MRPLENVSLFIDDKDPFYPSTWTISEMAGKKKNLETMWKRLMKQVDLEKPTVKVVSKNVGKCFESVISAGAVWHGTRERKKISVVLRHGRTRKEMHRTVIRIGKQKHRAVEESLHALYRRSPVQDAGAGNGERIVKRLLSNPAEVLYISCASADLTFFGL